MSNPQPITGQTPSEEMKQLLEEFALRSNPKYQSGLEDLFLEKEGPKILSYIRFLETQCSTLQREKERAVKIIEKTDCRCDLARVCKRCTFIDSLTPSK